MIRALALGLALLLPAAGSAAPAPIAGFAAARSGALPYRLLAPPAVKVGQTYPLVVVLHGSGQIGSDNVAQVDDLVTAWARPDLARRFAAYVAAPQVASRSAVYALGEDGLVASRPGAPMAAILALVEDLARTLPIDRSRIYVTGFSMGASTAMNLLVAAPDTFAAAVAFSGVPPPRTLAGKVAAIPMTIVHGDRDPQNPVEPDRAWVAALRAAGGAPRYIEVEGLGHDVPGPMIAAADWRAWLFAQHR